MKYSAILSFVVLGLGLAGTGQAEQKGPVDCTQMPGLKQLKCIDKGGSLTCVGNDEMCCKKNAQGGKDCFDDPDDMPSKQGTKAPVGGGGNTVAPTKSQGTIQPAWPTKHTGATKNAPAVK